MSIYSKYSELIIYVYRCLLNLWYINSFLNLLRYYYTEIYILLAFVRGPACVFVGYRSKEAIFGSLYCSSIKVSPRYISLESLQRLGRECVTDTQSYFRIHNISTDIFVMLHSMSRKTTGYIYNITI